MRPTPIRTLYYCVALCLLGYGCAGSASNGSTPKNENVLRTIASKSQLAASVTQVKAALVESRPSEWKVEEKRTTGGEDLRSVYFVDDLNGWVGGKAVLYRTLDGGKTWQQVGLKVSQNGYVTQIIFRNISTGWAVVQQEAAQVLSPGDNHFWLMMTRDGGETWTTSLDNVAAVATGLRLADDREAWFAGTRYTSPGDIEHRDFLLHTLDGGEHWQDVSEQLNKTIDTASIRLVLTDVMPETSLTANALMHEGSIFRTEDGGRSWRQINGTIDNDTYACICHIGVTEDGRLWAGGGKNDRRSVLGVVAVRENEKWKEYLLSDVYFSKILFVSRDQILASGTFTPDRGVDKVRRYATISYSSDGGATWSLLFKNPRHKKINMLTTVGTRSVCAVGDGGLILLLRTSQKASRV